MEHSDGTSRYGSGTPRTPTTPTFEQLLQASGDGSRWPGMNSPTYNRERDVEDHGHDYPRKSVLAKVKDRARRWRQNLGKKKGVDQDNGAPSWGVSLEEDDFGEEDAVYLGAPMYESELAPEDCKENARQHPRANPVISEKHILPNSPRQKDPLHINSSKHILPNNPRQEDPLHINSSKRIHPNSPRQEDPLHINSSKHILPNSPTQEDPLHINSSKHILPNSLRQEDPLHINSSKHILPNSPRQEDPLHINSSMSTNKTMAASRSGPNHDNASVMQDLTIGARQGAAARGRADVSVARQNPASPRLNTWDKGISVREYLSHKLEPGEDDRALSQVITDAMSSRKSRANGNNPTNNVGIVEKVKDAVSSFLHAGESSSSSNAYPVTLRAPISNTAPEIVEEESHGRILQAN